MKMILNDIKKKIIIKYFEYKYFRKLLVEKGIILPKIKQKEFLLKELIEGKINFNHL